MIHSKETKKELRKGIIVMCIVFAWGLLILFVIAALLGKPWVWHLSWNLIPVIAFLAALVYDVESEVIPDVDVEPKEVWCELDDKHITIIKSEEPLIKKSYASVY